MSLVLYGGGIGDNRGSIGGNTFSRSKFGATIRAKTSPINVINAHTSRVRGTLQSVSNMWGSVLTQVERAGWNAYALLNPLTNVFGQISYLSGMQWFVKCAINQQNFGVPITTTAPIVAAPLAPTSLSVTAVAGSPDTINVTRVEPALVGTNTLAVWITPNINVGVAYVNSVLRAVTYIPATSSTDDIATDWTNRFHGASLIIGRRISILAFNLCTDNGLTSAGLFATTIIT